MLARLSTTLLLSYQTSMPVYCGLVYLLGRDLVVVCPHVDLLVRVHAGEDEEHARAPRPAHQQPPQPEDDGSLVLLEFNLDMLKLFHNYPHLVIRSTE